MQGLLVPLLVLVLAVGSTLSATPCDIAPANVAAQTSTSPFKFVLSAAQIRAGNVVSVTLQAPAGDSFQKFAIVAKVGSTTVGVFQPATGVTLANCGAGANTAAVQANTTAKNTITVTWVSPVGVSQLVTFSATVVRNSNTYWTGVKSSVLSVNL